MLRCRGLSHRRKLGVAESTSASFGPRIAGVLTGERSLSHDGIELTLATNVVGPFLLTKLLTPLLLRSAPARVINVSSGGMYTQRLQSTTSRVPAADSGGPSPTRAPNGSRWC